MLRNFGLKVGAISRGRFETRIRELADGNPMLETATTPMLRARATLRLELAALEKHVRQLAQDDPVCRRLMTMPGIGAVVALTFRAAVDDPARFRSSKRIGPWVGLTPSHNQSGERDVSGGITKAGDVNLRRALCQAATVMMNGGRSTWLRTWGHSSRNVVAEKLRWLHWHVVSLSSSIGFGLMAPSLNRTRRHKWPGRFCHQLPV